MTRNSAMQIVFEDRSMVIVDDECVTLIISDLHLGFEEEVEERGAIVPAPHLSILERVVHLIEKYDVSRLYIIGDVKHTIVADVMRNWELIPEFMENLPERVQTTIIPGNHDGDLQAFLPRKIAIADIRGEMINKTIGLLHGHTWPAPKLTDAEVIVMGHNHPSIRRFVDVSSPAIGREGRVRYSRSVPVILRSELNLECVRENLGMLGNVERPSAKLIVLPHFNELISGLAVNYPDSILHGPFFQNNCVDISSSEVLGINGIYLGTVEWLREKFNETIKSRPLRK
jgi:hypothetical protein